VPVYVYSPDEAGPWAPGAASRWWLHHALVDMAAQLEARGLRLIVRAGESESVMSELVEETGASSVYWNRCYEPHRTHIDGRIKADLKERGLDVWSGNASLLHEPWEVATQAGQPYKVFTPFSRACAKRPLRSPVPFTGEPVAPGSWPDSLEIRELNLLPSINWDEGMYRAWTPTRKGGWGRLGSFLGHSAGDYKEARDLPAVDGTSKLSPYLHFGQIGPRELVNALQAHRGDAGVETYYNEIIWREFAHHVLYHFPDTPLEPLQAKFDRFPWKRDEIQLEAWKKGMTGYPVVDAGMRQLWRDGWMHNRVRMIVASFLVKHLLQSWVEGARWFWDTLVDADLASNTLGWQWAGGCGADAAPYFRIFNPMTQGKKFDREGKYVREFVPELERVPDKYLHEPWEMPEAVQRACGVIIGEAYPHPIVEHRSARERALEAFATVKGDS